MQRYHYLAVIGALLIATGMVLLLQVPVLASVEQQVFPQEVHRQGLEASSVVLAQTQPEGAEYVGSDTCFLCHSSNYRNWSQTFHPYMIQDPDVNPEAVLADFSTGEEVRETEINGETRAYTVEDITFTMGSKYRQRYIMETDDGYVVLPGQWNMDTGTWVQAGPGDWLNGCAGCHTTGYNVETQTWSELSITCEACHGPGSVHVEAAQALQPGADGEEVYAMRQTIVSTVDAAVCGQCHTRGTSPDGEQGYPVGYVVGGPLDETMFQPVAPTGAADDPDWWSDGTEKKHRQQYITWLNSRHGNALTTIQELEFGQDFCLACHSTDFRNQDPTFAQDAVTLENAQFSITCVTCHAPHGEQGIENQLTAESYDLCVSCHTGTSGGNQRIIVGDEVHHPMREMFEGISFLGLEPNPSPHFANEAFGPVCASCHMVQTAKSAEYGDIGTHTWQVILPTEAEEGQLDSCTSCHTPERDPDNTPENLTGYIEEVQADTQDRVEALQEDLDAVLEAHPEWDPEAEEKPEEQQIADRIHTLVSFVESDGSWGFHNPDYTDDILSEAEDLMDELLDLLDM